MSALLELAERCEAATGPDRELDTGIAKALGLTDQRTHMSPQGLGYVDRNQWAVANVARYTASVDAAMTLVPDGALWEVELKFNIGALFQTPKGEPERAFRGGVGIPPAPTDWQYAKHFTSAALALCAAALRARAAA